MRCPNALMPLTASYRRYLNDPRGLNPRPYPHPPPHRAAGRANPTHHRCSWMPLARYPHCRRKPRIFALSRKAYRARPHRRPGPGWKTKLAVSKIDRAVSKGIIPKNRGARIKSRLMKRLNNITSPSISPESEQVEQVEEEQELS